MGSLCSGMPTPYDNDIVVRFGTRLVLVHKPTSGFYHIVSPDLGFGAMDQEGDVSARQVYTDR